MRAGNGAGDAAVMRDEKTTPPAVQVAGDAELNGVTATAPPAMYSVIRAAQGNVPAGEKSQKFAHL